MEFDYLFDKQFILKSLFSKRNSSHSCHKDPQPCYFVHNAALWFASSPHSIVMLARRSQYNWNHKLYSLSRVCNYGNPIHDLGCQCLPQDPALQSRQLHVDPLQRCFPKSHLLICHKVCNRSHYPNGRNQN